MLKVALVGCGHMGSRHAAVIAADPACELAAAVDLLPERAKQVTERWGGRASDVVPEDVDAVVVATPTSTHVEVARPLLQRGLWCLVEKPLAHTRPDAERLDHERCVVGHIERFNPALRAAGPLAPRMVEARRIAPPTGRGRDVDVVLDLMIHDLDLVLGWMRPDAGIAWLDAAGVGVDGIDTASVRLRSTCGVTATLLASRVAGHKQRLVRCYEPGRTTTLDLLTGRATVEGAERRPADDRDALTAQWQAFTNAIRGQGPRVPGSAGVRAVALAEQIVAAIRSEA